MHFRTPRQTDRRTDSVHLDAQMHFRGRYEYNSGNGNGNGKESERERERRMMMVMTMEKIERLAAESAVVVFSTTECCMSHVVKRLLCGLGVSPTVYELDEEPDAILMCNALSALLGGAADPTPAVFVGGKLIGGLDRVMTSHINGSLVPLLKDAGALWL